MTAISKDHSFPPTESLSTPGILFQQWQWEAALDSLRRQAPESMISPHWEPTGIMEIDAAARAHIAEWALFTAQISWPRPADVIESLIFSALRKTCWDLYTVEKSSDSRITVRGLRDPKGFQISWLEGREAPPRGETLALRPAFLESQGLFVSTLPLRFAFPADSSAVMSALLRAFGQPSRAQPRTWRTFMSDHGSRILLEYALSGLRSRAAHRESSLDAASRALRDLQKAFRSLEGALTSTFTRPQRCTLPDGAVAILEEPLHAPQIHLFSSSEDAHRYLQASSSFDFPSHSTSAGVAWVRVHQASPGELHPVEWELSRHAGIDAHREGLVRIQSRSAAGLYLDPTLDDYERLRLACLRFERIAARNVA